MCYVVKDIKIFLKNPPLWMDFGWKIFLGQIYKPKPIALKCRRNKVKSEKYYYLHQQMSISRLLYNILIDNRAFRQYSSPLYHCPWSKTRRHICLGWRLRVWQEALPISYLVLLPTNSKSSDNRTPPHFPSHLPLCRSPRRLCVARTNVQFHSFLP